MHRTCLGIHLQIGKVTQPCYRIIKIAANIAATKASVLQAERMAVPMFWIGAGSKGLPPMKGVGVSPCELSDGGVGDGDCAASLVAVDCVLLSVDVASVEDSDEVLDSLSVVDDDVS